MMLRRTQLHAPTLQWPDDPTGAFSHPNPRDPCLESLLCTPSSHQAFGRISCHMSAPPRLATALSEATQVSPLLALSSAVTLSDNASYVIH